MTIKNRIKNGFSEQFLYFKHLKIELNDVDNQFYKLPSSSSATSKFHLSVPLHGTAKKNHFEQIQNLLTIVHIRIEYHNHLSRGTTAVIDHTAHRYTYAWTSLRQENRCGTISTRRSVRAVSIERYERCRGVCMQ